MMPNNHEHADNENTPLLGDGAHDESSHRHSPSKVGTYNRISNALLAPLRSIMRAFSFSKATRMWILVCIDVVFLCIELGTGYYVGSLALIADAFHMLNDVISLAVGLWAVRIAARPAKGNFTYGWQRAEILGAFFNGVFLVALCVTIFLEAIQRLVSPPDIDNPELIGWVGLAGLISNLFGLVLFFDHGHSHEDEEHDHDHGHAHKHGDEHEHTHETSTESAVEEGRAGIQAGARAANRKNSETIASASGATPIRGRRFSNKDGRRESILEEHIGHPSSMRQTWIDPTQRSDDIAEESESPIDESRDDAEAVDALDTSIYSQGRTAASVHDDHHHRKPKQAGGHGGGIGHNHGDLNMQGIFLHVLGDCLGNIGVIATALFIKFTHFPQRFYADPIISIVITGIILKSAIPLCIAASRILLQATPPGVDINEIENDINDVLDPTRKPGSKPRALAHHLHVWQLTDTKLVASVHVRVQGKDGAQRYMALAKAIHTCLHEYGIDSSTIQPEFDERSEYGEASTSDASTIAAPETCLMECGIDCKKDGSGSCCKPSRVGSREASPGHSDHAGHDHDH